MERIKLIATDGMILTNGEVYGRVVLLGTGDSPDNWNEITEAEYAKRLEADDVKALFDLYGVEYEE